MVFLTVNYMFLCSAQAWRLRSIYQKITRVLDNENHRSVVFKRFDDPTNEGENIISVHLRCVKNIFPRVDILSSLHIYTIEPTSLARLVESNKTSNDECIWSGPNSQGLSVDRIETVSLLPFITFPRSPSMIPFRVNQHKFDSNDFKSAEKIYALIEVECHSADADQGSFIEVKLY
jgi:hypothetical protein